MFWLQLFAGDVRNMRRSSVRWELLGDARTPGYVSALKKL